MSVFIPILQKETGNRIKELMEKSNLKVRDIQEACGFEQPQAVYKWLNGQSLPAIDNLVVLSYVLHTNIDGIIVTGDDAVYYFLNFPHSCYSALLSGSLSVLHRFIIPSLLFTTFHRC